MNRRRLFYIFLVIAICLIGVGLVLTLNKSPSSKVNQSAEQGPLTIKNSEGLSKILLDRQYNAVYFDLSTFVPQKVKPDARQVIISNVAIEPDGTVKFSVSVDSSQQTFDETVNRSIFDKITISIPKYNYQKTIKVY